MPVPDQLPSETHRQISFSAAPAREFVGDAAIVAGGASGLGAAAAQALANRGAKVAIFDLNESAGTEFAASLDGAFFKVDVSDDTSVRDGVAAAEAAHGIARLLVNCAGTATVGKTVNKDLVPHSLDAFPRTIEINLIGTFNLISKFAAWLAALETTDEDRGVIVNTASVAAYDGQIGQAAYASS